MLAMPPKEQAKQGMMKCSGVSMPLAGSHRRFKENSMTSKSPTQNAGMETPISDTTMASLSRQVFCPTAEATPMGTPIIRDSTTLTRAMMAVRGNLSMISADTDRLLM